MTVLDFESADGLAGIAVWGSAEGFSEEIEHAVATRYVEIADGAAAAEFDPLPPGVYAVTVFHGKNDNKRFDKNWLGMPREAWGVSNNARPRFLVPRFDEARLELAAGPHAIEIRVD